MMPPVNVIAYTQGQHVPSARFRVRQYIPDLAEHGIFLKESYTAWGGYPPHAKWARPFWGAASLMQRLAQLARPADARMTLLQRELFSTLATLERFTRRPRLFDVDDAVWLPRPAATQTIARACDGIICGNAFLANRFSRWHKQIYILPTAIDIQRFKPAAATDPARPRPVIVWSGSSSGFVYLHSIEAALQRVLTACPDARLRIIADRPPRLTRIDARRVEFWRWDPQAEVIGLQQADIGIMPLIDTEWARGKCSFKLLAYLACGLPVVADAVGMNTDILSMAKSGLAANGQGQWVDALLHVIDHIDHYKHVALKDRATIAHAYGTPAIAARLAAIIRKFC